MEDQNTWSYKIHRMLECLHVPLIYQLDIIPDIVNKDSSILQENESPRRIPIVVDVVHRRPQEIPNPYRDYHGEADEDEIALIEQTVNLPSFDLETEVVPIPASRHAVEALEKVKVENLNMQLII